MSSADISMCAPSSDCPRRDTCKRALKPCQPVGPRQSVSDHYYTWGNNCPFYRNKKEIRP